MTFNALIVEDEALAAERLRRILSEVAPEIVPLDTVSTVREAVDWMATADPRPDLVFLDIHLADGSAFELLEQVDLGAPIIFTTAYDQYALQAFKTHSVDYLLKPIRPSELRQSLDKFQQLYIRNSTAEPTAPGIDYQELARALRQSEQGYTERFLVQVRDRIRAVPAKEIAVFFSCLLYTSPSPRDS